MQPHVTRALHDWSAAWTVHERAAQTAFTAAFPALSDSDKACQCFGKTLRYDTPGEGKGKVCLDDHGRATIDFDRVPKAALGAAVAELFGPDWFDEGPGGFAEAKPGNYHYEDEVSYAEYEIDIDADGYATFAISYLKIEDIVIILDGLESALAEYRTTA
ncbi:hypothetical protein ACIO3O_36935 [Streptomyces sp. NPDC087440]|uniref:hypothetical protein n=1 Tax=Streptomyces sp. NPDC087440 TaxID=3365790 RepID=UPI00381E5011